MVGDKTKLREAREDVKEEHRRAAGLRVTGQKRDSLGGDSSAKTPQCRPVNWALTTQGLGPGLCPTPTPSISVAGP